MHLIDSGNAFQEFRYDERAVFKRARPIGWDDGGPKAMGALSSAPSDRLSTAISRQLEFSNCASLLHQSPEPGLAPMGTLEIGGIGGVIRQSGEVFNSGCQPGAVGQMSGGMLVAR
jgi:hypothetical protein